jgi:hypothetical protein
MHINDRISTIDVSLTYDRKQHPGAKMAKAKKLPQCIAETYGFMSGLHIIKQFSNFLRIRK